MSSMNNEEYGAGAKAGEFDFLNGHWKISHRQLKAGSVDTWDSFEGEASCWSILGGTVSVEELRIPARHFSGMGLRILNPEKQRWSDFWVNPNKGLLPAAGVLGYFHEGRGVFVENDMDGGQAILVRGVWDQITPQSCRWEQASSRDGGKTWITNWSMAWRRVDAAT
ncbi:MAG: hypothetical protein V4582_08765 [Pseudomonadota bacterium]